MAMRAPRSLKGLLLLHETAFLALVIITGGMGGVWAYFWQQSSVESLRIHSLLSEALRLRGDIYRQTREITRARLTEDPSALEQYWNHLYRVDRAFNTLRQQTANAAENEGLDEMRWAYELMQAEMNKVLAEPRISESERIRMLDPAYEQWMLGSFQGAFQAFSDLMASQREALEAQVRRWTRLAPLVIPAPIALAAALLAFSHRSLQRRFVRPMESVAAEAVELGRGRQGVEVPVAGVAEVTQLARSLNTLASELAASRDALVATERQAALGALVPVVAHNIRNPLASIRATVQVADLDDVAELAESREEILATVDRLERWVSSLLSYLHPLEPKRAPTRLGQVLDGALGLLRPRLEEKRIAVERAGFEAERPLALDVDLLEQAVYGLLLNAVEASPPGASIRVALVHEGRQAFLRIRDQGPGIPPDVREGVDTRTLAPGRSTKRFGTGLGIPFAAKVAQAHGGRLRFEAVEAGTCVRLELPGEVPQ